MSREHRWRWSACALVPGCLCCRRRAVDTAMDLISEVGLAGDAACPSCGHRQKQLTSPLPGLTCTRRWSPLEEWAANSSARLDMPPGSFNLTSRFMLFLHHDAVILGSQVEYTTTE